MPYWLITALGIGGIVLGGAVLVMFLNWLGVRGMGDAEVEDADQGSIAEELLASAPDAAWAEEHGYAWVGAYRLRAGLNARAVILAWQSDGAATFFCVYHMMNRRFYDLVTQFERGVSLTTGSSPGAMLYPYPPGTFVQAFPGVSLGELFDRHIEGEAYLADRMRVAPVESRKPFEDVFVSAIRGQMAFVRSVPFWWVRVFAWYAQQKTKAGKTIQVKYPDLSPADVPG